MNLSTVNSIDTSSVLKLLEQYRDPSAVRNGNSENAKSAVETAGSDFAPSSLDEAVSEPVKGRYVNIWA